MKYVHRLRAIELLHRASRRTAHVIRENYYPFSNYMPPHHSASAGKFHGPSPLSKEASSTAIHQLAYWRPQSSISGLLGTPPYSHLVIPTSTQNRRCRHACCFSASYYTDPYHEVISDYFSQVRLAFTIQNTPSLACIGFTPPMIDRSFMAKGNYEYDILLLQNMNKSIAN